MGVVLSMTEKYVPSIVLDDAFLSEIWWSIQTLKERGNNRFNKFVIVSPSDSIPEFIHFYQQQFNQIGWSLTQQKFVHPGRPSIPANSLKISKISNVLVWD